MTSYSYELPAKQSSRVLEQAIRTRSPVWVETVNDPQPQSLTGSLVEADAEVVVLAVSSLSPMTKPPALAGQYCQLMISVSDTRYLAMCDLVQSEDRPDGPAMVFSRPRHVQVLQRRQWVRRVLGRACPVTISWEDAAGRPVTPTQGQMCDLSLHGLAMRVPEQLDRYLFIGDRVHVRFSLSACEEEYVTRASVSHKERDKGRSDLVVGVEFASEAQDQVFQSRLAEALRDRCGVEKR